MTSPYINTKLTTSVLLHPYQFDNRLYLHLKKNLESKIVGRCFSHYGYIVKIIKILSYKDGLIEAENTESSALFDLEFSCKICAPLKNMTIICQVDKVNKLLITAINGPILVVITNDRVSPISFFKDKNNNIRYKQEGPDNKSAVLGPNDFIKVTLQTIQFYDGDEKIKAIGFIEGMAKEEEMTSFYADQYKETDVIVDFDEYNKKK
ncbi:MAG: DNA-directed RNA polymerase, subunit E'/Rpb8 [Barrevirus sp.]|uniref:DNA-directed RNA polymerase, subunit E'/Rpb8 n=1 Tax=Barrevirus sp. TaxID=2487763 RepID=A0A3G4ZT93_9VIRU|nr:MAG: DNA-directed RNA polymerase, subunit E'/Rpb8 [Barrevirus sp.]